MNCVHRMMNLAAVLVLAAPTVQADPVELSYDDGSAEITFYTQAAGDFVAARFTPVAYPARVVSLRFLVGPNVFGETSHRVWILDDNGPSGAPSGNLLGPGTFTSPQAFGWIDIMLPASPEVVISSGSFYVGVGQVTPGFFGVGIGVDQTPPSNFRMWMFQGGWFQVPNAWDAVLRATVDISTSGVREDVFVAGSTWGRIKALLETAESQ